MCEFPKDLDEFTRASEYIPSIAGSLSTEILLYLYARFKQATEGTCNTCEPGFFQMKARQKWKAWNALRNLSIETAKQEYVSKVTEVDPDWKTKVLKSGCHGTGPRVSRPLIHEENGDEINSTSTPLIELVKDNNIDGVSSFLLQNPSSVNDTDKSCLTALHWASDRGFAEIAAKLLDAGACINALDEDRQTALHYACSCEHVSVARLLLERGADKNLVDGEGETAHIEFLES